MKLKRRKTTPTSIKFNIVFWLGVLIVMTTLVITYILYSISSSVIVQNITTTLNGALEQNVNQIIFSESPADYDYFVSVEYNGGYLLVGTNFGNNAEGVVSGIFDENNNLIYGENPLAGSQLIAKVADLNVQKVTASKEVYYISDLCVDDENLQGIYVRSFTAESDNNTMLSQMINQAMVFSPIMCLVTILFGYFMVSQCLSPLDVMSRTSKEISEGSDLTKRIPMHEEGYDRFDELHDLGSSFNDMMDKIEESFTREKRFTSDVSHELRTPIAVIQAHAEMLQEEDLPPEDVRESIEVIGRQTKKLGGLVSKLLMISRLDQGNGIEKDDMDFSELCRELCEDYSIIRENDIDLESDIEPDICLYGDKMLLHRMVTNLIANAYKYGNPSGHIWVTLKKDKEEKKAVLKVKDDGIGISNEAQSKIWDRFYKVDSARTNNGTSAGLGLSMVKKIAEVHGGTVSVESQQGKGSEFTVEIAI